MADAVTVAKCPSEKIGDFNKRLRETCEAQPVTDTSIVIIHGQPVVTLFSEMIEADEEDVAAAKEDGEELALGELIPSEDPLVAQVCAMDCSTDASAGKTQVYADRLFERSKGAVSKTLHASGHIFGFVEGPDKKTHYCQQEVGYMLVAYFADAGGEEEPGADEKADEQMAKELKKK